VNREVVVVEVDLARVLAGVEEVLGLVQLLLRKGEEDVLLPIGFVCHL